METGCIVDGCRVVSLVLYDVPHPVRHHRIRHTVNQYHVQVVVAGVVVTKTLFWTDLVTVFGLFVTDFAQSDYDHFSYDHLYAAPSKS